MFNSLGQLSALLLTKWKDRLLDVGIADVEMLEVKQGCLSLFLALLQNSLHRICASDQETENLLFSHTEQNTVSLVHGQEMALIILCN